MVSRNTWRVRILMAVALAGVLWGGVTIAQQRAAAAMATAANAFLASLTAEQRAKATFALNADERTHWNFIPTSMFPRNGLPLKEMTEPQRQRAHDLLKASLSQAGYQTATAIMDLENILKEIEGRAAAGRAASAAGAGLPALAVAQGAAAPAPAAGGRQGGRQGGGRGGAPIVRDAELYFFSIFGTPSASSGWALRIEGHHLSMHFAIDGAKATVVTTPFFMGSNPAEVREGPKTGFRALGAQEDSARALLASLTEAQKTTALIAPQPPGEIATATTVKIDPLTPAGLLASDMTAPQRDLLMKVLDSYTVVQTADVAADRMAKIRAAGIEKIGFVWAGSTEKGQRYHYRIQGPTFLIEHNNTQNQGNHVHSVWRDFNGDFGRDLLAEHLKAVAH
jgi:hypothetical protein